MLRRLLSKRIIEIKKQCDDREILIETDANFFGLESRGILQIRGNCLLLLTKKELVFGLFKPATDITIPLSSITFIDVVKWHLNKNASKPLLKVFFTNQDGVKDSVAWLIDNPQHWKISLEKLL